MSKDIKPAIVLVHGAWHVPEHYNILIDHLQQAGFEAFCPLLPTCDEAKRATADVHAYANTIRSQITSVIDQSREIIMLLHSYGGVVGTEAVQGLSISERADQSLP